MVLHACFYISVSNIYDHKNKQVIHHKIETKKQKKQTKKN